MQLLIEVIVRRGAIAESHHAMQAEVCDARGVSVARTAEADRATTFRSSAKPFQLLPLVERGHADRAGLSDEELAVMAASHTGSPYHVGLVRGLLDRLDLPARLLACGYHEPSDPESQARLAAHPGERSPLYNNCSGKHAGMLLLARSEGWPLEGYEKAEHPVQRLMRRTVAEVCGMDPAAVAVAVDGCSASVFGLPLAAMARAYAVLSAARAEGDARARALDRIRRAMQRYPMAVGGRGRFSTTLMEAGGGRWVAKGGAEGLQCVGIPGRGLGLALKCEDGQGRGVAPAVIALLEQIGEIGAADRERLRDLARPVLRNHAGLEVGFLETSIRVASPAAR
ncbi:MAG TPA: asparaginase [Candidatus Eisenbacteria bacterium]|jgi:L-asparaginase II